MMPGEISQAVEACRRWLRLDRDVLVSGDTGSGKTTVLEALVQGATRSGTDALLFSASTVLAEVPFGALLTHDAVLRPRGGERPTVQGFVRLLSDELSAAHNIVGVDDVGALDAGSAQVLERLVRRPDVRLVATVGQPGSASSPGVGEWWVRQQVAAEVRVPPLGFRGMSALLASRLQGTPDAGLISSLVARSAGNPGVALALLDGGRFSGAVQMVDGLWSEVRAPDGDADQLVVRTLTRSLPPEALEALEVLAWTGPVALDDALRLVGADSLAALGRHERLTVYRNRGRESLAVSPPSLGRAVRSGLGGVRRQLLTHQAGVVFGEAFEPVSAPSSELGRLLLVGGEQGDDLSSASSVELTALVHERAAVQDAARRAQWQADPSMDNAVLFLDSLMTRPAAEHLDEIFRETRRSPADPASTVVAFQMREAQWILWQTQDVPRVTSLLREAASGLGPLGLVLEAQAETFQRSSDAQNSGIGFLDDLDHLDHRLEPGEASDSASVWVALVRAGFLLEAGQAERSLEVLDAAVEPEGPSPLRRYLEAARSDALLLMGHLEAAERHSRQLLEDSYAELDPLGIRLHSSKLAEALYLTGRSEDAWRVLSPSLRLGPPSPFGIAYYERTLALAAVIRADAGDLDLARVLEREMNAYPLTYRPVLGSMRTWARAAISYASGDDDAAEALLLESARRDAAGGTLASALLCRIVRRRPCSPAEAGELREDYDRAPLRLFAPLVRAHLAVAGDDEAAMLAALGSLEVDPGDHLAWMILDTVDSVRLSAGGLPLSDETIRAAGGPASARPRRAAPTSSSTPVLSDREYEVALLARAGMSNREIADRLVLSVRTVENHVYRLLRKLGLDRRENLQDQWSGGEPGDVPTGPARSG